jgi:hypothetical protein
MVCGFSFSFFLGGRSMVSTTSSCLRSHSIWLMVAETLVMSSLIRSKVFTEELMSASEPGDLGSRRTVMGCV